ncbi:MAG: GerMN domain-containing protein [Bacilli bacterium]
MLKIISFRIGFVIIVTLFLLLMVYIIPSENKYSLELLKKQQLEYVNFSNKGEAIYLLDNNDYIAKANIVISSKAKTIEAKAKELLEALVVGSRNENILPNGFRTIIPANTKILDVKYTNGLIEVNFSKQLLDIKEAYEEKMIEAIVYTLTSINGVNKVMISVEGKLLTKLPKTNTVLLGTLDKKFGINKVYDLDSISDVTSVTVYYINKYKDQPYYIPVTKYVNDKKDKIKIIIDELASGPIYEPNLMSFLNSKAKLLNYELQNNQLILNFNDYIYTDMNSKNILEEVSYCIALSVFDNYDVDTVIFNVNEERVETVTKALNN